MRLSEHADRNRAWWDAESDAYQARHAEQLRRGAAWGVWQAPEDELRILGDVAGRDVLELGCGAAQWSIELARRGARATGIDLSERQLEHAREAVVAAGVDVTLVHGSAEQLPFADASFDVAFCDHGATSFADPHRVIPEAARVLRPGGRLAFSMWTPWTDVCWPGDGDAPEENLRAPYFGVHRLEDGEGTFTFQLPYGEWIRLFRRSGLCIADLVEIRPGEDAQSTYVAEPVRDWARRWPLEHVWVLDRAR